MNRALAIIAGIPARDWIDLGYMLLVPAVTVTALPLLILWAIHP